MAVVMVSVPFAILLIFKQDFQFHMLLLKVDIYRNAHVCLIRYLENTVTY